MLLGRKEKDATAGKEDKKGCRIETFTLETKGGRSAQGGHNGVSGL